MKVAITFNPEKTLIRNEKDVMFTQVDNETVIMNTNTGRYIGLNPVATDVWNLLEKKINFNQLIKALMEEYEVDEKTCRKDSSDFVQRLLNSKLLSAETK